MGSELPQRRLDVRHGLEALRRLLREAPFYDRGGGRLQPRRLVVHDGVQRAEDRVAFERTTAGDQLVEDGAQAEDIRACEELCPRARHQNVGRLQVPVQDTLSMRSFERFDDLGTG